MGYLDKRITTAMPSSQGEDWQPLMLYRNSLMHGMGIIMRFYLNKTKNAIFANRANRGL